MSSDSVDKPNEAHLEEKDPNAFQTYLAKDSSGDSSSHQQNAIVDPAMSRYITRKLDLHLLPWLFGLWFFAFLERSNIGNAKIDGLVDDLGLDGNKFNAALSVFYILYILIDVPSNVILKRVGAGHFLTVIMICWGIVGTFMGLTKSYAGLIVCRLLLGLCEGGLFGGMILYVSMFYPRHEMLLRIGLWYCAAPLSGAAGGLLAAGFSQIQYHGYNRWPWIFIIEGAITTLYGCVAFFFLPHTPGTARFFTEDEKRAAVQRLHHDMHGADTKVAVDQEEFAWKWFRMAFLNINTLLCCWIFFLVLIPIYSYSLFLPTIITGLGYSGVIAQLFTVPPNVLGTLSVVICAYTSDKYKVRGPFLIGGSLLAIGGYIMLIASANPHVQYGGTFLVAAGVFQSSPTVCAWLTNNLAPHYVRATAGGLQVAIGNCAAFVATFTYLSTDAPRYQKGHAINIGALSLIVIFSSITMAYNAWENRLREQGKRDHRLTEGAEKELGYRHPRFRYTI